MVAVLIVVAVVVLGVGFYLTRGAGGPGLLSAEGRAVDSRSRASPLGDPIVPTGGDQDQSDFGGRCVGGRKAERCVIAFRHARLARRYVHWVSGARR
jgi:hypothetical protein